MRRVAASIAGIAVAALAGCGSAATQASSAVASATSAAASAASAASSTVATAAPSASNSVKASASATTSANTNASTDLTGTWKQSNSNSTDAWQEAVIEGDTIEVFWVSNKGDTRSLFWSGTYVAPKDAKPYTWTSQANTEKMQGSILASQDPTKDFTIDNGSLSWKASMMGTSMIIRATKTK